jgi:5'-nucleotidase
VCAPAASRRWPGLVKALRESAPHSVVLSNGDNIGGTPIISALFFHESTIDLMSRLGVDISSVGNHEFDAGYAELLRVLDPAGRCREPQAGEIAVSCALGKHAGASFPSITANVLKADGSPAFAPSIVKTYGGIKVGFIGAVTRGTPNIVVPSGVAGLRFTDEADAINAEAARLQAQGVQALVAVIHEGGFVEGAQMEWNASDCPSRRGPIFDIEKRLAPAVDVVLTGHTHQGYRCVFNGRPVMQATALGRGLSVLDLVLDPATGDVDRSKSFHRNLPVFNEHTDPAHRELIASQEPAPYAAALRAAVPDAAIAARLAEYYGQGQAAGRARGGPHRRRLRDRRQPRQLQRRPADRRRAARRHACPRPRRCPLCADEPRRRARRAALPRHAALQRDLSATCSRCSPSATAWW